MTDLNKLKDLAWQVYTEQNAQFHLKQLAKGNIDVVERLQAAETRIAELSDISTNPPVSLEYHNSVITRMEKAEAELARRDSAAGEPVLYALRFKNSQGVPNREINDNCLFRSYEKARAYGLGGNYVTQPDGKIERVPNPALDPEVIPLYTEQPPAALPPEIHTRQAIERLEKEGAPGSVNVAYKWGYNKAIADAKYLGCQPPKEFVVKLPDDLPDDGYNTAAMCNWARNEMKKKCAEAIRAAGGSIADE